MKNKLYQLEHLVNNGGSEEEIEKLRAELGIVKGEKEVKKERMAEKQNIKPKDVLTLDDLTVDIYNELKAQEITDRKIMTKYNAHTVAFNKWKHKHGLVNPIKSSKKTPEIKVKVEKTPIPQVVKEQKETVVTVNQPAPERPDSEHYHVGKVDVWTFADENFNEDEVIGFHRINALKYIVRYGKKGGYNVSDLKKAIVSLEKLVELEEAK